MRWILFLMAVALLIWWWRRPIEFPIVDIPEVPTQTMVLPAKVEWEQNGFHFIALAKYHIRALVLGAEHYKYDSLAKICQLDLALAWGPMAKRENLDRITFWQTGRWINYEWKDHSGTRVPDSNTITQNSANTHVIGATPAIEKRLKRVRAGEVFEASGYLVDIQGPDGWRVTSSLSREDTAGGSCEVFWVEDFRTTKN